MPNRPSGTAGIPSGAIELMGYGGALKEHITHIHAHGYPGTVAVAERLFSVILNYS